MKVAIIQEQLPHYRISIFNRLAEDFGLALTVLHGDRAAADIGGRFEERLLQIRKLLSFRKISRIRQITGNFDVIILPFDIRYLVDILQLTFFSTAKVILWGQGISPKPYSLTDIMRLVLARFPKAILLYNESKKPYFIKFGIPADRIFVANNTMDLPGRRLLVNKGMKNSFIFTGTLYKEKRVDDLLYAFSKLCQHSEIVTLLKIIGDGPEKEKLINLTKQLNIKERVEFCGFQNDPNVLQDLHDHAYACISPDYAGLSVLQSLGRAVPFITKINAFSGGETEHIIHGRTGFFYDGSVDNLFVYMNLLQSNEKLSLEMAENSFQYFNENCGIELMLDGFVKAIHYNNKEK
ncbi:MAG: glycosyltransferase [Saprospiraceae bacterium]